MKQWSLDFGKKETWSQASKEEGAIEVVQDLEREARHFQRFKAQEIGACKVSW